MALWWGLCLRDGNSLTLPVQRYIFEGRITDVYGSRNGYRMAPYHRADISATYTRDPAKSKKKRDIRVESTGHLACTTSTTV